MLVVVAKHGVVGRQDGPAAVAENGVHALIRQHLDDHIGAAHAATRQRVLPVFDCFPGRGHVRFQKIA